MNQASKLLIVVKQQALFRIGSLFIGLLAIVTPLLALILLLIYLIYHWWHKFRILRKKVKKEAREAEQALHKAFCLLKESINEQIKILEKSKSKTQAYQSRGENDQTTQERFE